MDDIKSTLNLGKSFDGTIVNYQPKDSNFRFLDYYPLVNQRIHKLGETKEILNDKFKNHYTEFLKILATKYKPNIEELIWFIYYQLLQDNIEAAIDLFKRFSSDIEKANRV